ncbi:PIN domain-containing protein [Acidobacteria bacterium AB60]|nr:PIN domain-containing protein [Acidobacteria bacterium AB60]
MIQRSLLDLNVLIALADQRHDHHQIARTWFASSERHTWGICPLTEAGFVRVTTRPAFLPGPHTFARAIAILQSLKALPGYRYWEIRDGWVDLTSPFVARISGHQQVTDAYLLGLAVKEDGVLVTFDRGLHYLAGPKFSRNVLVLG